MSARRRKIVIIGLLNLGALIPAVVLLMIGQPGLASAVMYGSAIAVTGLLFNARLGVLLSVIGGAAAAMLTLLHPYPIAGGIAFGTLTAIAALTSLRGVHSAALMVPVFTGFFLTAPIAISGVTSSAWTATLCGIALTAGGLWSVGLARLLLGTHLPHLEPKPVTREVSVIYAAVAGVILAVSATLVLVNDPSHAGTWLLLTLLILLQPDPHDTWRKSLQRLGGTLLGGVVAIVFVVLPLPPAVSLTLGALLLFIAFAIRYVLRRPYWQYVAPLTVAVILLDSTTTDRGTIAVDRVGFTLIGGAIAIAVTLVVKAIVERSHRAPKHRST